jgi:hypothetical protein
LVVTDAYILRGATDSQVERAVRAQGDLWQTHFREYREGDDDDDIEVGGS